jgi:thioredoxin 1
MINLTKDNFDKEVIQHSGKVLVDFWAEWCGPCLMLSPIIDEIATEKPDIKIAKINVDEEIDLAAKFNVSSIPCIMIFEGGQPIKTIIGFHQKQEYLQALI